MTVAGAFACGGLWCSLVTASRGTHSRCSENKGRHVREGTSGRAEEGNAAACGLFNDNGRTLEITWRGWEELGDRDTHTHCWYYALSRWLVRTYCTVWGTLFNALWWSERGESPKGREHTCVYDWFILLYNRNHPSIVKQLSSHKKLIEEEKNNNMTLTWH